MRARRCSTGGIRIGSNRYARANIASRLATPAPLPSYVLAIFAGLSKLSYPVARAIWLFVDAIASGLVVWALWKLTRDPPLVLTAIVGPTLARNTLAGESTPIVVAALALAPFSLPAPHVALPSLVALALFAPLS
ncbi:MAG: hypothetical protein NVSMB21_05120 [Vulcanimicrobiaceae bacterium]